MSKFTLILGDKIDPEALSPTAKAVQRIMTNISQIANGVDSMGRSGLALSTESFPAKDFDIEGVKAGLKEKCVVWGVVENDGRGGISTTIDPASVKKYRAANPHSTKLQFDLQILVKRTLPRFNSPALVDEKYEEAAHYDFVCSEINGVPDLLYTILPGDEIYYFHSKNLKANNPFLGKKFYEIEETLVRQHGEQSKIVRDIREVVELCRKSLYGNLEPTEDDVVTNRLRELILQVGPAARAIIQDFDRDAYENEGWEPIDEY